MPIVLGCTGMTVMKLGLWIPSRMSDLVSGPPASVTFNDRYKVRAYVRNLFDTGGPLARTLIRNLLQQPSFINTIPLQPRTVGIGLEAEF